MHDNEPFEIPVGFADEVSFPVPIENFNFSAVDSPEDVIREHIASKKPIAPLLQSWVRQITVTQQEETVRAVMSLIVDAKKPRQRVDEIAFACGMLLAEGATESSLAKKHGVSKQAIHKGVMQVCEVLGMRKTRTMRGECARERMTATNYRR